MVVYKDAQCTWFDALLSCGSTLHAVFNTVVQFPTLNTQKHTGTEKEKYSHWFQFTLTILKQYSISELRIRLSHFEVCGVCVYYSMPLLWCVSYLLGVELVKLCLLTVPPPQTQHFGLGTVGHIYELLIPPALIDCADVTAQDDAVVTHLTHTRGWGKKDWMLIYNMFSCRLVK